MHGLEISGLHTMTCGTQQLYITSHQGFKHLILLSIGTTKQNSCCQTLSRPHSQQARWIVSCVGMGHKINTTLTQPQPVCFVSKDDAEPARLTTFKGFTTGQQNLVIQEASPQQHFLLKGSSFQVLESENRPVNKCKAAGRAKRHEIMPEIYEIRSWTGIKLKARVCLPRNIY